jgi:site-specific recombinase XerD
MKNTDFAFCLNKFFVRYLPGIKGSSPSTIDSYRYSFINFIEYLQETSKIKADRIKISDLSYVNVCGYLDWLLACKNNGPNTRNQRQAAINSFVRFLMLEQPEYMNEYQRILAIPVRKVLQPEISYAKTDGIKLMMNLPDTTNVIGLRDYVILAVMYTTGIRVSELISIKVKDLSLYEPETLLVHGKGNKYRYVPLMKYIIPSINRYLDILGYNRPGKENEWLFKNHMKKQFTRQGINYIVSKYTLLARSQNPDLIPKDFSPHKIRHSSAMGLVDAGVDLIYIRDLLGHVSVKTTEVYAKTNAQLKRKAIEAAGNEIIPEELPEWESNADLKSWLKCLGTHKT